MARWANGQWRYRGLPHPRTQRRRILDVWHDGTDAQRASGRLWYPSAYDWCQATARKHGLSAVGVAGAFSWLSPGVTVAQCARNTLDIISAYQQDAMVPLGIALYGAEHEANALDCLAGYLESLEYTTDNYKVRCFFRNIIEDETGPDGHYPVTVDRWAARVVGGTRDQLSGGAYLQVAASYRSAARKLGERPDTVQAVTWSVLRTGRSLSLLDTIGHGLFDELRPNVTDLRGGVVT